MDQEEVVEIADSNVGLAKNVRKEVMSTLNDLKKAIRKLEKRGIDEEDLHDARVRLRGVASDLDIASDGAASVADSLADATGVPTE